MRESVRAPVSICLSLLSIASTLMGVRASADVWYLDANPSPMVGWLILAILLNNAGSAVMERP